MQRESKKWNIKKRKWEEGNDWALQIARGSNVKCLLITDLGRGVAGEGGGGFFFCVVSTASHRRLFEGEEEGKKGAE